MALPPLLVNSFSIEAAEPLSRAVSMTTFAPAARHAVACAFCFSGSFRALLIDALTPAFANAAFMAGASNCTQRTDDFVSGSSTQTSTLAACFVDLAVAAATTIAETPTTPASSRMVDVRKTFFTWFLLLSRPGGQGECQTLRLQQTSQVASGP